MPGYSNFALNQNNSTTTTYGTPMGPNGSGNIAYSANFKPLYLKRGANGVIDVSNISFFQFEKGTVHYFEATYVISYLPGTESSAFFFKTIFNYNDDGTLSSKDSNPTTEYLENPGTVPLVVNNSSFSNNLNSTVVGSNVVITIYLAYTNTIAQGIYHYI